MEAFRMMRKWLDFKQLAEAEAENP